MPRKQDFPIWVDGDEDELTFDRTGGGELFVLANDSIVFTLTRNDAIDIVEMLSAWIEEEA